MKHSRHFWRGLFFISIITALCSGLALPAASVRAAPMYQLACGLMIAQWTFDQTPPPSTTTPAPSTANATSSASQSGVNGLALQTSGSHSGNAWSGSGWSPNLTPSSYFEFDVSTVGYTGIAMSFWLSRSNTGPANVSVQYSMDGSNFTEFNTYTVNPLTAVETSIDLSSIAALDNNTNAKFRIYGLNAAPAGTLRIDDVTFTGCQPATPTPTSTDTGTPTPTGTATNTGTPTPTGPATSTGTPTATVPSTGSATNVVISEFRTSAGSGAATNEYIELYNPTSNWIASFAFVTAIRV